MSLELVTGYWGIEHVTAEQDADRNAGIVGSSCYVLPIGEQLRAEAVTSNMVRIFDGTGMAYGRQFHVKEGAYENVVIENGTAGLLRNDLIVIKYKKDEASGIEGVSFEVLKGASAESATDPVVNNADIRTGVFESEIPLYRVRLNGLAIEAVEPLFYVPKTVEDLSKKCVDLEKKVTELNGKIITKTRYGSVDFDYTVGSNDRTEVTGISFDALAQKYKAAIPVAVSTGSGYVQGTISNLKVSDSTVAVLLHNIGKSETTQKGSVRLLCLD